MSPLLNKRSRARRRISRKTNMSVALLVLFAMLLPSVATADPPVDSAIDVVAHVTASIEVYPSDASCGEDGSVEAEWQAPLGSGSDHSGLILKVQFTYYQSTDSASESNHPQFQLCGAVKPAAGNSSADCREFAATLRGEREYLDLLTNEPYVDVFEVELTAIDPAASMVWSLTGDYVQYRDNNQYDRSDDTPTGETGEFYLSGLSFHDSRPHCDLLTDGKGWYQTALYGRGYQMETSD